MWSAGPAVDSAAEHSTRNVKAICQDISRPSYDPSHRMESCWPTDLPTKPTVVSGPRLSQGSPSEGTIDAVAMALQADGRGRCRVRGQSPLRGIPVMKSGVEACLDFVASGHGHHQDDGCQFGRGLPPSLPTTTRGCTPEAAYGDGRSMPD